MRSTNPKCLVDFKNRPSGKLIPPLRRKIKVLCRRGSTKLLFGFILVFTSSHLLAQTPDSVLNAAMRAIKRHAGYRQPVLSFQLDKDVFIPDESISFACYVLDKGSDAVECTTLHAAILDPATGRVVVQDQFVFLNGLLCTGSLIVPDTVANGQYQFVAVTNTMAHLTSEIPFRRTITIKSTTRDFFQIAGASVVRKAANPDSLFWHARITTDSGGLAAKGRFHFTIRGGGKEIMAGFRMIDAFGEIEIGVPAKDSLLPGVFINALVTRGLRSVKLSIPVDLLPQRINVRFYPESGYLVNGLVSRMVMALHRNHGKGFHCSGVILEDSTEVERFRTDIHGFTSFYFLPKTGKRYSIRLDQPLNDSYLVGSFPDVRSAGVVLRIENGVVRDSIALDFQSTIRDSLLRLLIYSDTGALFAGVVHPNGSFKLPSWGWPVGVAGVVILSGKGEPLCERAFYVAPHDLVVSVESDSAQYHPRSRVTATIKVTNTNGRPVKSILSLSSALTAKVRFGISPDVTEAFLLSPANVQEMPVLPPVKALRDDTAIDQFLLSGPSRVFSWRAVAEDTVRWVDARKSDNFGWVNHNEKPLTKPVTIGVFGQRPLPFLIKTDSAGHFDVPDSLLIAPLGTNPTVSLVNTKAPMEYELFFRNRYDSVIRKMASTSTLPVFASAGDELPEVESRSSLLDVAKTLKAAVVIARGNEDFDFGAKDRECPDYICKHKWLNCTVCGKGNKENTKPIIGVVYKYNGPWMSPDYLTYKTCVSCKGCRVPKSPAVLSAMPGIHYLWEFYNVDSVKFDPMLPDLRTTLFWGPTIWTDDKGEAKVTFYTNDVKGRMNIRLQGCSAKGVFKGESSFEVIP
jgi:hypothetical protein